MFITSVRMMVIDIFHRCIQIIDEEISDSKEGSLQMKKLLNTWHRIRSGQKYNSGILNFTSVE